MYVRDCSLVSSYPLLLFGGDIQVKHRERNVTVDNWIEFQVIVQSKDLLVCACIYYTSYRYL